MSNPTKVGTPEELAYAAGIIDGEGCISIFESKNEISNKEYRKPGDVRYRYKVIVKMVDPQAVELLLELFGGCIYLQKPRTRGNFPGLTWTVSERRAAECMEKILPYLRVKRDRAELLIRFCENVSKYRYAGRGVHVALEDTNTRRQIIEQVKDKNQRMHMRPEGHVRRDLVQ